MFGKLERTGQEAVMSYFKIPSRIRVEGMRNSQRPGLDLNRISHECQSGSSLLEPVCPVEEVCHT